MYSVCGVASVDSCCFQQVSALLTAHWLDYYPSRHPYAMQPLVCMQYLRTPVTSSLRGCRTCSRDCQPHPISCIVLGPDSEDPSGSKSASRSSTGNGVFDGEKDTGIKLANLFSLRVGMYIMQSVAGRGIEVYVHQVKKMGWLFVCRPGSFDEAMLWHKVMCTPFASTDQSESSASSCTSSS